MTIKSQKMLKLLMIIKWLYIIYFTNKKVYINEFFYPIFSFYKKKFTLSAYNLIQLLHKLTPVKKQYFDLID